MTNEPMPTSSRRWTLNPSVARQRTAERAAGRHSDDGVSLIEVMVAFTVLMIVILPLSYLLTTMSGQAAQTRQREAALELSDQWMEILSNASPPLNATSGAIQTGVLAPPVDPAGVVPSTKYIGGVKLRVKAEYTLQAATGVSNNLCAAPVPSANNPGVIVLEVIVSWDKGKQSVSNYTNLQYPQPGVQTDGFIAVQVTNSTVSDVNGVTSSNRVQSIPVTITDTNTGASQTVYPDLHGCVFDQVVPDPYTIALAQPSANTGQPPFPAYSGSPPFVDPYGNQSVSATTTVTVTQKQSVNVTFDEGVIPTVTYTSATAVQDGVQCPGNGSLTCITTGAGSTGSAVASWGSSGTWSTGPVTGASRINAVACTSGYQPTCVGVGNTSSGSGKGVIVSGASSLQSDIVDSIPSGITTVTQVVCPSSDGCYAIGTATNGSPVLLAGSFAGTSPIWQQITDPAQVFSSLSSISCPTATICELSGGYKSVLPPATSPSAGILRLDGDPGTPGVLPGTLAGPVYTLDNVPTLLTSVGTVSCPSANTCLALATGDSTGVSDPVILTAPIASTVATASTWVAESAFGTGVAKTLTGLSCTPIACAAIGTTSAGAAAWVSDLTQNPDGWNAETLPATVTSLNGVACSAPSGTEMADCAFAGTGGGISTGTILNASLNSVDGIPADDVWSALNPVTLPTSLSGQIEYLAGISCEATSAGSVCAATGAAPSGPFVVTSTAGTSGTWSNSTPATLGGSFVSGIPVEVSSNSINWTTEPLTVVGGNNVMTNTLYPVPTGYTIAAGDCPGEATYLDTSGSTHVYGVNSTFASVPGSTPGASVPLGTLSLVAQLVNGSTGVVTPVSGATVTLQAASYTGTSASPCAADTYTLPTTGADGLSRTAVPYGLYTATVKSGSLTTTVTVVVSTSSVTAGSTQYPLPSVVPVVLP